MLCKITHDFHLDDLSWILVLFQISWLLIVDFDEFKAPQRLPGIGRVDKEEWRACHWEDSTALLLKFNASDQIAVVSLVNMRHLVYPVDNLFLLYYSHLKIDGLLLPIMLIFLHILKLTRIIMTWFIFLPRARLRPPRLGVWGGRLSRLYVPLLAHQAVE